MEGITINRNKTIRLIAMDGTYKRTGRPLIVGPVYDEFTKKHITGYDLLTQELKDSISKDVVNSVKIDSFFLVNDAMNLDLRSDDNFIIFLCAMVSPQVAMSKSEIIPSKHAFYIFDEEEEAVMQNDKYSRVEKALMYLKDKSDKQIRDFAPYLGINSQNSSFDVIKANIRTIAFNEPQKILDFMDLAHPERTLFVSKLITYDVIELREEGFFFKNIFIALTKAECLTAIFRPDNAPLLARLTNALDVIENPVSKAGEKYIREEVKTQVSAEIEKAQTNEKIANLKLEYMELTGKKYLGDNDVLSLEEALDTFKAKEKEVEKFLKTFEDKEIGSYKKSAKLRGISEELINSTDDVDVIKDAIIDQIRNEE